MNIKEPMLLIQIETPYAILIAGAFLGLFAWLCKKVVTLGEQMVAVQTAIKYYFETTAKGAAIVLDSDNPAPPEIRLLLKKHAEGKLTKNGERQQLMEWLKATYQDESATKSERGTALAMLAAVGALKRLGVTA